MTIHIHIDRLIFEGIPLSQRQRRLLQASLEAELGRLVAGDRLGAERLSQAAAPHIDAGEMGFTPNSSPVQMGQQIAQAVYRGMGAS